MYEKVDLEIQTTENVPHVFLQFFSKSLLLMSKKVPIKNKYATFQFYPKFSYAPDCSIVAFYVRNDGHVISAITRMELSDKLPNYVSI